ncbi:hypothetical protein QPL65_25115, partial [Escherichia coli]|uniref:hypothetical protein n=1 Tax=Escherichia coli TaxID=562 RepID=UPI0026FF0020
TTVQSRAVVEPWTLSIASAALWFVVPDGGLSIAYILSIFAAALVAVKPLKRSYGVPRDWRPDFSRMSDLAWTNLPLAIADIVEWGS